MDGLLIIDKPAGLTSHDVVDRVRRVLKSSRVGHTGTLDPFATGVLVLVVGKATRLAQFLDKDEKEYEALVRFGYETDTGDCTGSRRSQNPSTRPVTRREVDNALLRFRGDIEQVPPMFSAKKVEGKKLYIHARKGEVIKRKAVPITVSKLATAGEIISDLELGTWNLKLRVACSAGTYIRALAEDIGRAVGTGAHLAELRRTRAGRFDLSQGIALDAFERLDNPASALIEMNRAVEYLPSITLNAERVDKTRSGLSTRLPDASFADGAAVRMLSRSGDLVAIGFISAEEQSVRPKVVLV